MNEVVTLIDGCSNSSLNSLTLQPWLSIGEVNMSMGSKKRIERSELVKLNEKIVSCLTVEAWDVRTTERMTSDSELK